MQISDANDEDLKKVLLFEHLNKYYGENNPTEYQKLLRRFINEIFSNEEIEKMSEEVLEKTSFRELWKLHDDIYYESRGKKD